MIQQTLDDVARVRGDIQLGGVDVPEVFVSGFGRAVVHKRVMRHAPGLRSVRGQRVDSTFRAFPARCGRLLWSLCFHPNWRQIRQDFHIDFGECQARKPLPERTAQARHGKLLRLQSRDNPPLGWQCGQQLDLYPINRSKSAHDFCNLFFSQRAFPVHLKTFPNTDNTLACGQCKRI